jgi:hypothetical protein
LPAQVGLGWPGLAARPGCGQLHRCAAPRGDGGPAAQPGPIRAKKISVGPSSANGAARVKTAAKPRPRGSPASPWYSPTKAWAGSGAVRRSVGPATWACRHELPRSWEWANQTSAHHEGGERQDQGQVHAWGALEVAVGDRQGRRGIADGEDRHHRPGRPRRPPRHRCHPASASPEPRTSSAEYERTVPRSLRSRHPRQYRRRRWACCGKDRSRTPRPSTVPDQGVVGR